MYKAILAIGVVAAACFVAGCGSSGEETAEAAVTKTQFIQQAEAICRETKKEGSEARVALEKAQGKELDIDKALKEVVGPMLSQEAEELRSLTPPEKDAAKLARMIDHLSKGADAYSGEGTNLKSTDDIEAFQAEAQAYGLGACRL